MTLLGDCVSRKSVGKTNIIPDLHKTVPSDGDFRKKRRKKVTPHFRAYINLYPYLRRLVYTVDEM